MPRATTHVQYFTVLCFETPLKNSKRVPGVRIDKSVGVMMAHSISQHDSTQFVSREKQVQYPLLKNFNFVETELSRNDVGFPFKISSLVRLWIYNLRNREWVEIQSVRNLNFPRSNSKCKIAQQWHLSNILLCSACTV